MGHAKKAAAEKKCKVSEPTTSSSAPIEAILDQAATDFLKKGGSHWQGALGHIDGVRVFSAGGALSPKTCADIIAWGEVKGFTDIRGDRPKKGIAYRRHGRLSIESVTGASALFKIVKPILQTAGAEMVGGKEAVGLSANLRLYRYMKGERFESHVDESLRSVVPPGRSMLTLLFYLSGSGRPVDHVLSHPSLRGKAILTELKEPLHGGDTVFLESKSEEAFRVSPDVGLAMFHTQGEDCRLHYADEVRRGVKYVLRTDVIYA